MSSTDSDSSFERTIDLGYLWPFSFDDEGGALVDFQAADLIIPTLVNFIRAQVDEDRTSNCDVFSIKLLTLQSFDI